MLRWLKDRKKPRKGDKHKESVDDYGFPSSSHDDKMYHIYEEIADLPHFNQIDNLPSEGNEISMRTGEIHLDVSFDQQSVFNAETLRKYIIGPSESRSHDTSSNIDGPYMVVPILADRKQDDKPPLPPPNDKHMDFTCAVVGRRNSNLSRSTESGVEVSYDSSESQGSEQNFDELFTGENHRKKAVEKSKSRREGQLDTSDTGCEYDMSTSSESDHVNYEYYLNKIEQNLAHKCKIREIIQQCLPEEDESDNESLTTVSSVSCCSSVRTTRQGNGHKSTDIDSDEGTMADHSESENSSGYYESFGVKSGGSLGVRVNCGIQNVSQNPQKQHYVKNKKKSVTKKCKHRNVDALSLCIPVNSLTSKPSNHRNIDALGLCVSNNGAFKKVSRSYNKSYGHDDSLNQRYSLTSSDSPIKLDLYEPLPGSSLYGGGISSSKSVGSIDLEGREVYSPPPCFKDYSSRNSAFPSKCSMARGAGLTNVYKSRGSQNRLLSDLIIMNYDRQLFIH